MTAMHDEEKRRHITALICQLTGKHHDWVTPARELDELLNQSQLTDVIKMSKLVCNLDSATIDPESLSTVDDLFVQLGI